MIQLTTHDRPIYVRSCSNVSSSGRVPFLNRALRGAGSEVDSYDENDSDDEARVGRERKGGGGGEV